MHAAHFQIGLAELLESDPFTNAETTGFAEWVLEAHQTVDA
jgi:hypothetical protein